MTDSLIDATDQFVDDGHFMVTVIWINTVFMIVMLVVVVSSIKR